MKSFQDIKHEFTIIKFFIWHSDMFIDAHIFFSFPLFIISIKIDSSSLELYFLNNCKLHSLIKWRYITTTHPFLTLLEYAQSLKGWYLTVGACLF